MTSLAIGDILGMSSEPYAADSRPKNITRALHNRENPYTLLSNKLLRDTSIRHSDRGLMAQLLSWSDYHNVCIQALVKKSVEGRDAIRGMIDRLITAGYIRMQQTKSEDGRFDKVVYQLFEESTGAIVANLDLTGIEENQDDPAAAQLDLFECELVMMENQDKTGNVNQSANGKAVNGKHDTNNNYDSRNTNFNSNKHESGFVEKKSEKETKESLLNKWSLDIKNSQVVARLGMAGLNSFVPDQETLNRYLIDFNQQHEKYKALSDSQRLNNFTSYLVRIKHTPVEYTKHLARLRALGFDVQMPVRKTERKASQRVQTNQANVNPFPVSSNQAIVPPAAHISFEGF